MGKKVYKFSDGYQMIDLADSIQTKISLGCRFYNVETEEHLSYRYFWDYLMSAMSEGYTAVEIDRDNHEVTFIR